MASTFPTPYGIGDAEWQRACESVVALPAAYRYAGQVWDFYASEKAAGRANQAAPILQALNAYTAALSEFVNVSADALSDSVRRGKIPQDSFDAWAAGVVSAARGFSERVGSGSGLGFVGVLLIAVVVAAALVGSVYAWSLNEKNRFVEVRREELRAAVAAYQSAGASVPPEVFNPPAAGGGAFGSGAAVGGLGVLVLVVLGLWASRR